MCRWFLKKKKRTEDVMSKSEEKEWTRIAEEDRMKRIKELREEMGEVTEEEWMLSGAKLFSMCGSPNNELLRLLMVQNIRLSNKIKEECREIDRLRELKEAYEKYKV